MPHACRAPGKKKPLARRFKFLITTRDKPRGGAHLSLAATETAMP